MSRPRKPAPPPPQTGPDAATDPAATDGSAASASVRAAQRQARAVRWMVGVGLAIVVAIGLVLLFLLTLATNNRELYERHYPWLLGLNVLVAVLLLLVLVWMVARLGLRLRRKRFGSRLLFKLAGIFGLVGLVPGLLIYIVSYQFVTRSIESWFDVKVEGALAAGVNLARVSLDAMASDMAAKTRAASAQLAQVPDAAAGLVLERIRDQLGATDVVLWSAAGRPLASVGQSRFELNPERPSAAQLRLAHEQRLTTQIEGLDDIAPGTTAPPPRASKCSCWSAAPAWACSQSRATCRPPFPCRPRSSPTPLPCRRPTANTRSGPSRATACAACTWARSP